MRMQASTLEELKDYERCILVAQHLPADRPDVFTIGWGHIKGVHLGMVWTQEHADEVLEEDVEAVELDVELLVQVPVNDNQFDALTMFAYNVGTGHDGLGGSTLLRLLNAGDYEKAADQFPRWNKSNGQVQPGLVRRRAWERALFLTPA